MATCTVPKWWGVNRGGMNLILTLGYEAGVTALMEHRHRWDTVPVPLSRLTVGPRCLSLCPTCPSVLHHLRVPLGSMGLALCPDIKAGAMPRGHRAFQKGVSGTLLTGFFFQLIPARFLGRKQKSSP